MKLIGRYNEFPRTEVLLFRTPIENIQRIIKDDKNIEVKVQEYKPRKITIKKLEQEDHVILPNKAYRHQVVLTKEIPHMLKVKIYSSPTNAKEIKRIGLESLEEATKKEKLAESLEILFDKNPWRID